MEHFIQKFCNWFNEQHFTLSGRLLVINPPQKGTQKYKRKFENTFLEVLVGILITLVVIYFHPTQEVMTCDSNIQCSVQRTYFGKYTYTQKIKFKPEYIDTKTFFVPGARRRPSTYNAYLILKDHAGHSKSPFVFYYMNNCHSRIVCSNAVEIENSRFLKYKDNPYNNYTVKSSVSMFILWVWLAFCAIWLFVSIVEKIEPKS